MDVQAIIVRSSDIGKSCLKVPRITDGKQSLVILVFAFLSPAAHFFSSGAKPDISPSLVQENVFSSYFVSLFQYWPMCVSIVVLTSLVSKPQTSLQLTNC